MKINELIEKRNELIKKAEDVLAKSKTEKRSLNAEELNGFNEAKNEIRSLTDSIEAYKAEEELRSLAIKVPVVEEKKNDKSEDFRHYLKTGEIRAQTVTGETNDSAIVPAYFSNKVIEAVQKASKVLSMVSKTTMNSASATIPVFTDYTNAAFTTEIVEVEVTADSAGGFKSKKDISLLPLRKRVQISDLLLKTGAIDPEAYLISKYPSLFNSPIESAIYTGSGSSTLLGITAATSGVTSIETIGAALHPDDLYALYAELEGKNLTGLSLHIHPKAMQALRTAKASTAGNYLLDEIRTTNTFKGMPVVVTEYLPTPAGTAGEVLAIVGNFADYEIFDCGNLEIDRVKNINKGVWDFVGTYYVNGLPRRPDAFRILKLKA